MQLAWIVLALTVVACAPRETAYMKNPATGQVVACGPYYIGGMGVQAAAERGCIEDYQRQGYVRVPAPNWRGAFRKISKWVTTRGTRTILTDRKWPTPPPKKGSRIAREINADENAEGFERAFEKVIGQSKIVPPMPSDRRSRHSGRSELHHKPFHRKEDVLSLIIGIGFLDMHRCVSPWIFDCI
jgi:hypothetical protein